jgi:hypothetical protein
VRTVCDVTSGGTSSHPHVDVSRRGEVISGNERDGRSVGGSDTFCCDFRFRSMDGMWWVS